MQGNVRPLPDGWRWVRLNEASTIISKGTTPTTLGHSFAKVGVPFLRAENVVGGPVDLTNVRLNISPETHSFLSRSKLQAGDLLITIAGTLGRVGFLQPGAPEINCNQAVAFVRLIPDIADVAYACFACQLPQVAKSLSVSEAGGTIKNLNLEQIGDLEIPLPPLDEQKRIAAILNGQMAAVERARAAAEAQLEAAKALPAAYLRAVFSSPEAQQWPTMQLGELCDIQLGKMLSPASRTGLRPRRYLRNANVQWGRFDLTDIAQMDFTEDQERKFTLRPGDLLVCEGGEPGRAAVWEGQIPSCLYQKAIHRLRPINSAIVPHFVLYRLWMGALQKEFVESHAKTTIAHLPAVRLQRLPIGVPTISEQQRIATKLTEQMASAERTCKTIEEELDAINKLPAALLRRAFIGGL